MFLHRLITSLENLEISGILTAVEEMSGILLKVRELSGKILSWKSGQKLFIVNCIFASVRVFSSIQLVLAWYEYQLIWKGVQGIVREFHSVWEWFACLQVVLFLSVAELAHHYQMLDLIRISRKLPALTNRHFCMNCAQWLTLVLDQTCRLSCRLCWSFG